jgi:hypothetical protein
MKYTAELLIFDSMGIEARTLQVHSFDAEEGVEHDCMC